METSEPLSPVIAKTPAISIFHISLTHPISRA